MTKYTVTVSFTVEGEERHAAKLADKVESLVLSSKRVVLGDTGSLVDTTITEQK